VAHEDDRIAEALRLLDLELQARIDRHPHGHLLRRRGGRIELSLDLPVLSTGEALVEAIERFRARLDQVVGEALGRAVVFRPGAVFCLRCGRSDCEHAAPAGSREVFAGYGPTGTPRFLDLGQLLLARRDERVEDLFTGRGRLVVRQVPGEELLADLLPPFREEPDRFRLHGQVVAGWYRVPDRTGVPRSLAVSFQVVSAGRPGRRRLGLNVLGRGPDGESLEHLFDRVGRIPWLDAARWAQDVLARIERDQRRRRGPDDLLDRRVAGVLAGLARRLARRERARARRTRHAELRHEQGDRPTEMAILDLSRAEPERVFRDTRRGTFVVLGERGRAHVFSEEGRHVTSVRYGPGVVERRVARGAWRPATPAETAGLRARVAGIPARDGGDSPGPGTPGPDAPGRNGP